VVVFLGSLYVLGDERSEDEYEEEALRGELLVDVRVPLDLEDVPSARAFRSFLILCAVTPARVASTGAAKMLTTEAQSIAKKQAPLDGLHPRIRYTLMDDRLYQKLYQAFFGSLHQPIPFRPYIPKVKRRIQKRFH
jgi:hypothetical protein